MINQTKSKACDVKGAERPQCVNVKQSKRCVYNCEWTVNIRPSEHDMATTYDKKTEICNCEWTVNMTWLRIKRGSHFNNNLKSTKDGVRFHHILGSFNMSMGNGKNDIKASDNYVNNIKIKQTCKNGKNGSLQM